MAMVPFKSILPFASNNDILECFKNGIEIIVIIANIPWVNIMKNGIWWKTIRTLIELQLNMKKIIGWPADLSNKRTFHFSINWKN